MSAPRKHAELIKAWADGATIEFMNPITGTWEVPNSNPAWLEDGQYRIQPSKPKDVTVYMTIPNWPTDCNRLSSTGLELTILPDNYPNIKMTFDGTTRVLKKVELI